MYLRALSNATGVNATGPICMIVNEPCGTPLGQFQLSMIIIAVVIGMVCAMTACIVPALIYDRCRKE
jgi:hypothetical protein